MIKSMPDNCPVVLETPLLKNAQDCVSTAHEEPLLRGRKCSQQWNEANPWTLAAWKGKIIIPELPVGKEAGGVSVSRNTPWLDRLPARLACPVRALHPSTASPHGRHTSPFFHNPWTKHKIKTTALPTALPPRRRACLSRHASQLGEVSPGSRATSVPSRYRPHTLSDEPATPNTPTYTSSQPPVTPHLHLHSPS